MPATPILASCCVHAHLPAYAGQLSTVNLQREEAQYRALKIKVNITVSQEEKDGFN